MNILRSVNMLPFQLKKCSYPVMKIYILQFWMVFCILLKFFFRVLYLISTKGYYVINIQVLVLSGFVRCKIARPIDFFVGRFLLYLPFINHQLLHLLFCCANQKKMLTFFHKFLTEGKFVSFILVIKKKFCHNFIIFYAQFSCNQILCCVCDNLERIE